MSERNGETAGVRIIAKSDTHVGQSFAVLVQSDTGLITHIGEMAVTVVSVQIIVAAIVRHEEVGPAVIVQVRPDNGETEQVLGIVNARFFRDIGERSVAIVVIQVVRRSFQSGGAALDLNSV